MEKKKKKKKWTEPKLTALVRRKPEEGILETCNGDLPAGPDSKNLGCGEWAVCNSCDSIGGT